MAENYKHLYQQMKKIVAMYQDELVPGFRVKITELESENTMLRNMLADAGHKVDIKSRDIKHGHWIHKPYEGDEMVWLYHCSECQTPNAAIRNYCGTCGAIMDGDLVDLYVSE